MLLDVSSVYLSLRRGYIPCNTECELHQQRQNSGQACIDTMQDAAGEWSFESSDSEAAWNAMTKL